MRSQTSGRERDGSTVQLHPEPPPGFSSSPTSAPASGVGFGTHACAVQVSFDLHCASVLHATHVPLGTSQTFEVPPSPPAPHSPSAVQPRQVWLV